MKKSDCQPSNPETQGSGVYSVAKIENDYRLFCPKGDQNLSVEDKQWALFYALMDRDVVTAWEFLLARKHDEWSIGEQQKVYENLTERQRRNIGHLLLTPPSNS